MTRPRVVHGTPRGASAGPYGLSMPEPIDAIPSRARSRRRPRGWREGGSTVVRWDLEVFGWSILSLGIGVLAARLGAILLPPAAAGLACQAVLWAAFVAPAAWAFGRSRPRGLLRFRWVDPVIGLVWGIALRLVQGALATAAGESVWPSPVAPSSVPFLVEAVAATIAAPAVEELYFRGVLLVAVYTVVRRVSGRAAASLSSLVVSSVLFVAAHALVAPVTTAGSASLALVGAVAATCVLATGRLWPAVLLHAVYNLTGVAVVVVASVVV